MPFAPVFSSRTALTCTIDFLPHRHRSRSRMVWLSMKVLTLHNHVIAVDDYKSKGCDVSEDTLLTTQDLANAREVLDRFLRHERQGGGGVRIRLVYPILSRFLLPGTEVGRLHTLVTLQLHVLCTRPSLLRGNAYSLNSPKIGNKDWYFVASELPTSPRSFQYPSMPRREAPDWALIYHHHVKPSQ